MQVPVPQQQYAGVSETAEKLEDLLCSWIGHCALELDDGPVASNGLLAAQKHVQFMSFDIALDEFQVRECLVGHGVQPGDLHIERRIRAAPTRHLKRRASVAYSLPGQVHAPLGIRQSDVHHAKVAPAKSTFLTLDAVAHLRLRLECDHAARRSDRAHHPETINSLVCPDIQHGRAPQSEAHHRLDLQLFRSKAITQTSNQKMRVVDECRSRDHVIHFAGASWLGRFSATPLRPRARCTMPPSNPTARQYSIPCVTVDR